MKYKITNTSLNDLFHFKGKSIFSQSYEIFEDVSKLEIESLKRFHDIRIEEIKEKKTEIVQKIPNYIEERKSTAKKNGKTSKNKA